MTGKRPEAPPPTRDDTVTVPMARRYVRAYLHVLKQTDPAAARALETAIGVLITNASAGR